MKFTTQVKFFAGLALASLACLPIVYGAPSATPAIQTPETVMITYHVKAGKEAEFKGVLALAWSMYMNRHLVLEQPHLLVSSKEKDDKTSFVEIFTWASNATPDNPPDAVKTLWNQMQSLCETRDGHPGLDISEVHVVVSPQPPPPPPPGEMKSMVPTRSTPSNPAVRL